MQLDQNLVNNEVERLEILFAEKGYDKEERSWFIESKYHDAKKNNDLVLLKVCEILLDKIDGDNYE